MLWRRRFSMAVGIIAALAAYDEALGQQPSRLDAIRLRGELRACIWPEYYAVSYRNPRSNELEGLDVDLARRLAARLATGVRFVETDFAGFMDRLRRGDCDVATMAVAMTPERLQVLAFTRAHLASGPYAVTTRASSRIRAWADIDTPDTVVAVAAGTALEPLMGRSLRQAELMVVVPPRTLEAELLAGRADVFITDYPYSRRLVQLQTWAEVIEPPARFGETPYGWATLPGDPAWLAELNGFLEAMRVDGTLSRAAARHGLGAILVR